MVRLLHEFIDASLFNRCFAGLYADLWKPSDFFFGPLYAVTYAFKLGNWEVGARGRGSNKGTDGAEEGAVGDVVMKVGVLVDLCFAI